MKKNYILILVCLTLCINKLKAQCPVTITASDTVICAGNTVSLVAGGGAMTYSWSTGSTNSSITLAPTSTTVYTLTGTNGGCTSSATVTITVNPTPTITINSTGNICAGGTATLTASGATTYSWNTGNTLSAIVVTPPSTQTYSVAGSIGSCTSSIVPFTVYVSPNPTLTVNTPNAICAGITGNDTLRVSGANIYTWAPAATLSSNIGSTVIANPNSSITYTVIGTSPAGCISTATVLVSVSPPITVSVSTTDATCGACNGSVSLSVTGGSAAYTYIWLPMGINTTSASNLCAGNYSVAIIDSNGCKDTTAVTIASIYSALTLSVTTTPASCSFPCSYSGGSASANVSGGVPPYIYWYGGVCGLAFSIATPSLSTGSYSVTVTDAAGCTADTLITIVSLVAAPTVGFVMQRDTTTTGVWYAYPSYSSSVTNATWYWGDGTSSVGLSPSHTYTASAHYNVCVTAFNSCGDSAVSCQNDSLYRLSQNSNGMISVSVVNNLATGINTLNVSNNQILIFPNPTTGNFTIETNSSSRQTLQIIDVNGRIILTQAIIGKANIDASSLNEGVYNVSIMGNEGVTNKRLVIVK